MTDLTAAGQWSALVRLLRPKQWSKNFFVLAPLVFSSSFLDPVALRSAIEAFVLFCMASSVTYIFNDINDIEHDRLHPKKAHSRPLAAGEVSVRSAVILMAVLLVLLAGGSLLLPKTLPAIVAYLLLNVAYTRVLKHEPVLDIFSIALGFELRVLAGVLAVGVVESMWMLVTTLCLALFLAALKRRQELGQRGSDGRLVLRKYTASLIDRYAQMSATGAIVFYGMFVMSVRPQLAVTVPLVLFGLFRYWYVVEALDGGESPTDELLADWQLLLTVLTWVGICVWVLWPR